MFSAPGQPEYVNILGSREYFHEAPHLDSVPHAALARALGAESAAAARAADRARPPAAAPRGERGRGLAVLRSASKISIRRFVITEKAPTRAFSWLKAATTAFTVKTLLRHYAKRTLTPRSLNVKLGPRRNYHKGRAAIRHYANQTARPL